MVVTGLEKKSGPVLVSPPGKSFPTCYQDNRYLRIYINRILKRESSSKKPG
jgi:hypothetical protein